jgi:chaperone required for assembly of F1-ATPase
MATMRRFYREVSVEPATPAGFQVLLDRRPMRTPAKAALVLPGRGLAEAIAAEWREQGDEVRPRSMPMTRLACTGIDRVAPRRAAVVDQIAAYAATDLMCYRAAAPPELVERQRRAWQPLLDWAARRYEARLHVMTGVTPRPQPPAALAALRAAVAGYDNLALGALAAATAACGSLVIALALAERHIAADLAWQISQLDESFQIERWGEDAEAAGRRAALKDEIETAERFLGLLAAAPRRRRRRQRPAPADSAISLPPPRR